ncbi:MAG: alanine--tRNA ligase [Erysipelotrichaceae bacterium]|jgi:alanyl-tRNA synthetase|nr:alanine--tRNA ligase [Erysipelotrichaceae bacterium]
MKYMSSNEIREMWLDFFKSKQHQIIKSASLIPINDPSLLWINSGIAALKKYFDGEKIPPSRRLTDVQKCIRTNDIENVGKTDRHQTFFEMMGNFSIGDYFRKEAIEFAFEILTSQTYFAFEIDKIYVTFHPSDEETRQHWLRLGLKEDHVIPLAGNYWEIGSGPAGPNTEVFYDRGLKYDPNNFGTKLLKEEIENDRYIEIWGIVFSQFNAVEGVSREQYQELPFKNIDTGAGLERFACILQGTESNFETDLFWPIIKKIETFSKGSYFDNKVAYRVIADHTRACVFALSDGEIFAKDGRGYVLRRLLRRAMVFAKKLGITRPFLSELVTSVITVMQHFYPELKEHEAKVKQLILGEEIRFLKTLSSGQELLDQMIERHEIVDGAAVFKLHDTFGFPFELSQELLLEKGLSFDVSEFQALMIKQKEMARNARNEIDSMGKQAPDYLAFKTPSEYLDQKQVRALVTGLFMNETAVTELDESGVVATDYTNFYAESGGQVSDLGTIKGQDFLAEVPAVFKAPNGQHFHRINVLFGTIKIKDKVLLQVDYHHKNLVRRHHSAAHLLQGALDQVLGISARQMGSSVTSEYLRFDFGFDRALTKKELFDIEYLVNEVVAAKLKAEIKVMDLEAAKQQATKHVFDDKYQDQVRVVTFKNVSSEFCGGSHVSNTEEIGLFKIVNETSIASGVRRIEAKASLAAYQFVLEEEAHLNHVRTELNVKSNAELASKLTAHKKEQLRLEAEIVTLETIIANNLKEAVKKSLVIKDGIKLYCYFTNQKLELLKNMVDELKNDSQVVVFLASTMNRQTTFLLASSNDLAKARSLFESLKETYSLLGGGRPTFVQGSTTKDLTGIEARILALL